MEDLWTPRDVADWLATDPPEHTHSHAIDELIDVHGHREGLRVWAAGRRLHGEGVRT